jgi:tRNA(Arg) A34 adenosine deaminase TadA
VRPGQNADPATARQIERLEYGDLRAMEAAVIQKRRSWLQENRERLELTGLVTPRRAYEILFREYMGLPLSDLLVTAESETAMTWLSRNRCPTLEACAALGLDTRVVCRAVYEKSTQALLSGLDPRLRFLRDYEEIRPYALHCRESIVRVDFEAMMLIALQEARVSRNEGNKGYGAVVALGDKILAREHDTATVEGDPSLHAEFKALRNAVRVLGSPNLSGAVLYSTCEPCPMCTGLAVWANLTTIVFGASIADTARMGKSRILIEAAEIARQAPSSLEVLGGVLKEQCEALYDPT